MRRLTSDNAWNVDASWSPDGRQIVYQSTREGRSDVHVMDVSTREVRRLSDGRGFNGYPRRPGATVPAVALRERGNQ